MRHTVRNHVSRLLTSFGLGFYATKALASKGAHCVITVRNPWEGSSSKWQISRRSFPKWVSLQSLLSVMKMDNCDFESIRTFTDEFKKQYDRLDIVCNNAGVMGLGCSDDKGWLWLWHSDSDESLEPLLDDCSPLAFAKGNSWEVWRCNSHPSVLWCFWKGWTHRRCCKSQQSSSSSWTDAILSPVCSWWFYRTLGSLWSQQVGQRHCLLRSWIVEWKTAGLGDKVKIQFLPSGLGWLPTYSLLHNKVVAWRRRCWLTSPSSLWRAQTAKHLGWVGCGSTSPLMAARGITIVFLMAQAA